MEKKCPELNISDDNFGLILNCAVRYSLGRQTYIPSTVIDFITPLLPYLNDKTLWCFDQDITEQEYTGGYGDLQIDKPKWMQFHTDIRSERTKRGHTLYKTWRSQS